MSRFKSNLYTVERRVWRNHKLCWIQNDDFTLFSGHHKTKIKEDDLPEWYVFGRYYKLWGFLSTKGITDLRYIPNLWINHFLKDDCLAQPITAKPSQKREKQSCENYMTKEDRQMDECQHAMEELRNIVEGISNLRDTAYAHYSLLVEQVLKDQITDEQQLEQIMDGLCDFCDEIRFIDLYRSLCRHIYYQYPQLVGEHVALFRALFEGPDEK